MDCNVQIVRSSRAMTQIVHMKKLIIFITACIFSLSVFAQSAKSIRVGLLNGPTCIPSAYMMENTDYDFEVFADPQALLPKLIKKEVDIGFLPVNVAAKVYNSGNKSLLCAAVTGLGNLSLITTDKNIRRFSDLKGKTVYLAGQGATPEYMLRFLLEENNLTWGEGGDLQLDYSIPTAQIVAQMISGKITYAVVPEPFATIAQMKSKKVYSALDLQKEYKELTGSTQIYPLSVMVVRAEFAQKDPQLLEAFLKEYEASVSWTISNPGQAGKLSEKQGLGLASGVVTNAIPVSNYVYLPAEKSITLIEELLTIFLNCESSSIGGKLPGKDFYYDGNLKNQS